MVETGKICLMLMMVLWQQIATAQLTYANLVVQYDSAWTYKNLQLIPIKLLGDPDRLSAVVDKAISLGDAIRAGKAKIGELAYEEGADINWLQITNHSRQPVLVNNGELLSGGKQDRVIAETKIIEPGKSDYIKVFCIEKGRWDDKAKAFVHNGNAGLKLDKIMTLTQRQQEVWKEIEKQFAAEHKTSDKWPYLDLASTFSKVDSGYYKFFMQKFDTSNHDIAGVLAISGNQIIKCEIFASADNFSLAFPSILKGLINFAVPLKEPQVSINAQKKFMDNLLQSEQSQKQFLVTHGYSAQHNAKVFYLVAYGEW